VELLQLFAKVSSARTPRDKIRTMPSQISQALIDRYAAGPSSSRTAQVKNLQENIRQALAGSNIGSFDTFLQGSYRNGTAIADINDVDIVALYDPWKSPESASRWTWLFRHIANILQQSSLVSGRIELGDKCVKFEGSLKADIVPAISRITYGSEDPIRICSRSEAKERDNFPRTHYSNGVLKQASTRDTYKATVRLFKRWARQYQSLEAPSFYIECAVHSVNDSRFEKYLPLSFASVGLELLEYSRSTIIPSVAGDKDILVPNEWHPSDFEGFQSFLQADLTRAINAMKAGTRTEADRLWSSVFGD
jgi:hypothetical protein